MQILTKSSTKKGGDASFLEQFISLGDGLNYNSVPVPRTLYP